MKAYTTKSYQLTLTKEQLEVINRACEVYGRLGMGQWEEIASWDFWHFSALTNPDNSRSIRDALAWMSSNARNAPPHSSIGIAECPEKFKIAFDVHRYARHQLANDRPDANEVRKLHMVDFDEPYTISEQPPIKIELVVKSRKDKIKEATSEMLDDPRMVDILKKLDG